MKITIAPPIPTDEKFALYQHYMMQWHGSLRESRADFEQFLYDSPARTIEFSYRDGRGRLLAAGICDLCDRSLSSVYFYFDPSESRRGLGTFGALSEIFCARRRRIPYYYLGYWIAQCASMSYKSAFRPNQLLDSDGVWREIPCSSVAPADWHQAAAQ